MYEMKVVLKVVLKAMVTVTTTHIHARTKYIEGS